MTIFSESCGPPRTALHEKRRYQWFFSDFLPGPESPLAVFGGGRAARLPEDWTRGRENGVVEGTNGT